MEQLLDLFAGQFSTTSELARHALAIGAGLVDHLAPLLFRHCQFGLGVGSSIGAATRRLGLGFLSQAGGLVARLGEQLRCALLGLLADLDGRFPGGGQHTSGFFSEHAGERLIVELHRGQIGIGLGGAQLTFQEALALLETPEFGCHHAEEVTDLSLVEAASAGTECSVGNRRR